jgi:beta-lactamase regulating signal transducer with metallopeptidase domain
MEQFETVVRFVLTTLVSGLWQAPLFALAAWLVLRIKPEANATTRHSVLATALFASLVLPVVTATFAMRHVPDVAGDAGMSLPRGAVSSWPVYDVPGSPLRLPGDGDGDGSGAAPLPAFSVPALSRFTVAIPRLPAFVIVGFWFAGAAFVLVRLVSSLLHLERLKRDALPLSVAYRERLGRWATATSGGHAVRLCTSPEIEIPIAVGLFDAMILLPDRLLEELEPHDVESIVLHELAHLRRADDWFNAVERFAQALLFFNPGILWLVAQLDLEREVACDDWVLQKNDALPYATCLAKVAETAAWPHRAMSAPGAFVTRRGMSIRIERLLSKQRDVRVRTSLGPAGAAVAAVAVLGAVAALVSPSFAYATNARRQAATEASSVRVMLPSTAAPGPQTSLSGPQIPDVTPAPAVAQPPAAQTAPSSEPALPAKPAAAVPAAPTAPPVVPAVPRRPVAAAPPARPQPAASSAVLSQRSPAELERKAAEAERTALRQENLADRLRDAASAGADLIADAQDPDYIDELARAGYPHLSVDELIALKSVGVSGDFIAGLRRQGLTHLTVQDLIKLRATHIDPEYAGAMNRRFGNAVDAGDLAGLRALGATPDYIDGLVAAGLKNLRPSDIQSLRALGVTPGYVRGLMRAGYPNLSVSQLQQLRALGIDADFIQRAKAHGLQNLSVDDLTKLKATGVL